MTPIDNIIQHSIVFSLFGIAFLYMFNMVNCEILCFRSLLNYLFAVSIAALVFFTFRVQEHLGLVLLATCLSAVFWSSVRFYFFPATKQVVVIGTKALIDMLKSYPSINLVAVVCFDDARKKFGTNIPNLGNLDDLPKILKYLENIPNVTIIAEQVVAQKLNMCVPYPVIAVDVEQSSVVIC